MLLRLPNEEVTAQKDRQKRQGLATDQANLPEIAKFIGIQMHRLWESESTHNRSRVTKRSQARSRQRPLKLGSALSRLPQKENPKSTPKREDV